MKTIWFAVGILAALGPSSRASDSEDNAELSWRGCSRGEAARCTTIAQLYYLGRDLLVADQPLALQIHRHACFELGDKEGCYRAGRMYERVGPNELARTFLDESCRLGSSSGCMELDGRLAGVAPAALPPGEPWTAVAKRAARLTSVRSRPARRLPAEPKAAAPENAGTPEYDVGVAMVQCATRGETECRQALTTAREHGDLGAQRTIEKRLCDLGDAESCFHVGDWTRACEHRHFAACVTLARSVRDTKVVLQLMRRGCVDGEFHPALGCHFAATEARKRGAVRAAAYFFGLACKGERAEDCALLADLQNAGTQPEAVAEEGWKSVMQRLSSAPSADASSSAELTRALEGRRWDAVVTLLAELSAQGPLPEAATTSLRRRWPELTAGLAANATLARAYHVVARAWAGEPEFEPLVALRDRAAKEQETAAGASRSASSRWLHVGLARALGGRPAGYEEAQANFRAQGLGPLALTGLDESCAWLGADSSTAARSVSASARLACKKGERTWETKEDDDASGPSFYVNSVEQCTTREESYPCASPIGGWNTCRKLIRTCTTPPKRRPPEIKSHHRREVSVDGEVAASWGSVKVDVPIHEAAASEGDESLATLTAKVGDAVRASIRGGVQRARRAACDAALRANDPAAVEDACLALDRETSLSPGLAQYLERRYGIAPELASRLLLP
jgi:hypothetical protein